MAVRTNRGQRMDSAHTKEGECYKSSVLESLTHFSMSTMDIVNWQPCLLGVLLEEAFLNHLFLSLQDFKHRLTIKVLDVAQQECSCLLQSLDIILVSKATETNGSVLVGIQLIRRQEVTIIESFQVYGRCLPAWTLLSELTSGFQVTSLALRLLHRNKRGWNKRGWNKRGWNKRGWNKRGWNKWGWHFSGARNDFRSSTSGGVTGPSSTGIVVSSNRSFSLTVKNIFLNQRWHSVHSRHDCDTDTTVTQTRLWHRYDCDTDTTVTQTR